MIKLSACQYLYGVLGLYTSFLVVMPYSYHVRLHFCAIHEWVTLGLGHPHLWVVPGSAGQGAAPRQQIHQDRVHVAGERRAPAVPRGGHPSAEEQAPADAQLGETWGRPGGDLGAVEIHCGGEIHDDNDSNDHDIHVCGCVIVNNNELTGTYIY